MRSPFEWAKTENANRSQKAENGCCIPWWNIINLDNFCFWLENPSILRILRGFKSIKKWIMKGMAAEEYVCFGMKWSPTGRGVTFPWQKRFPRVSVCLGAWGTARHRGRMRALGEALHFASLLCWSWQFLCLKLAKDSNCFVVSMLRNIICIISDFWLFLYFLLYSDQLMWLNFLDFVIYHDVIALKTHATFFKKNWVITRY